jgi:hypothetical protein
MNGLLSVFLGGIGGALVAAFAAWWQNVVAARIKVDQELRGQREASYLDLWKLTRLLPKYPRADDVTYAALQALSEAMREWYFDGAGIYLSSEARRAYGKAQEAIQLALGRAASPGAHLADTDYDTLQAALSALRTELTSDLLSRQRSTVFPWRRPVPPAT